jgi:hypothetical protein
MIKYPKPCDYNSRNLTVFRSVSIDLPSENQSSYQIRIEGKSPNESQKDLAKLFFVAYVVTLHRLKIGVTLLPLILTSDECQTLWSW